MPIEPPLRETHNYYLLIIVPFEGQKLAFFNYLNAKTTIWCLKLKTLTTTMDPNVSIYQNVYKVTLELAVFAK